MKRGIKKMWETQQVDIGAKPKSRLRSRFPASGRKKSLREKGSNENVKGETSKQKTASLTVSASEMRWKRGGAISDNYGASKRPRGTEGFLIILGQ